MNFLIVDDHPLIVEGYSSILQKVFPFFCFYKAHTVDQAFSIIRQNAEIDCFILDYDLPNCEIYGIVNGVDLTKEIRRYFPLSKIMIITAHAEVLTIFNIHKKAYPDALMVKKDVTAAVLLKALEQIQNGERFYSETVKKSMAQISKKDLMCEENNIQILLLLAKGYKIKNIGELLGISASAVQKRILLMKEAFDVMDNGGLVREAVKQHYI